MRKILDLENKPYNKCFACGHLKTPRCNGPRTSSMELLRWCEYMRDLRNLFGLTNEEIAEKADVSIKTINKIMSCHTDQDIMRDTARRIEQAILGVDGGSPCYLMFCEEAEPNNQKIMDGIQTSHTAEISMIRDEAQRKIQYLLAQVEYLRKDVEYLRSENDRKAQIIDKLLG